MRVANAGLQAHQPEGTGLRVELVTKPLELGDELRFWEIEDDATLEEFLFGDLLAAATLELSPEELGALSPGYRALVAVLEFEQHCQFDGWLAVENEGAEQMGEIARSYRMLGLTEEAEALEAVIAVHRVGADSSELAVAYRSVANSTPSIEDRMPQILHFVRGHPEQFRE